MDQKHTALIIDDDAFVRNELSELLEVWGYEPVAVDSGKEAAQVAGELKPSVALIDLLMDDMPGLAVMVGIRDVSPDTACIVITGQAPERSAVAAAELGAYSYVMKPPQADHLAMTIKKAIEWRSLKRACFDSEATVQAVLDVLDSPALLTDAEGTVIALNKPAVHVSGLAADELIGSCCLKTFPAETIAISREQIEEVIRSGSPAEPPENARAAGIRPICDGEGEVRRLLVYCPNA